jgi:hypothetical protein
MLRRIIRYSAASGNWFASSRRLICADRMLAIKAMPVEMKLHKRKRGNSSFFMPLIIDSYFQFEK